MCKNIVLLLVPSDGLAQPKVSPHIFCDLCGLLPWDLENICHVLKLTYLEIEL